jgi:hypothetical protein
LQRNHQLHHLQPSLLLLRLRPQRLLHLALPQLPRRRNLLRLALPQLLRHRNLLLLLRHQRKLRQNLVRSITN